MQIPCLAGEDPLEEGNALQYSCLENPLAIRQLEKSTAPCVLGRRQGGACTHIHTHTHTHVHAHQHLLRYISQALTTSPMPLPCCYLFCLLIKFPPLLDVP